MNGETQISNLYYVCDYLTETEQSQLIATIDQQPWLSDLKRRVQHYGYKYDYKSRTVLSSMFLGRLPTWAAQVAERLHHDGWDTQVPDQLIINEYLPGQGIASHIDCEPCFGDTILSLSLGSACVMVFTKVADKTRIPILMEARSLVVMQGEARYHWKHGILARKNDEYHGQTFKRERRISLTFRNIILER